MKRNPRLGVLLILDGFGINQAREYNCIALAHTPVYDYLIDNHCPYNQDYHREKLGKTYSMYLKAVGPVVGMPKGAKGSTAVGHEVISGVEYMHPMLRVEKEIKNSVLENTVIDYALQQVLEYGSALHLMGLLSPNREHSDIKHLYAILRRAKQMGIQKIWLHFFSDGRGTPPFSAARYAEDLLDMAEEIFGSDFHGFHIATVGGRDMTMNRSKDSLYKTERSYRAIIEADAPKEKDIFSTLKKSYEKGITDEYTDLRVLGDYDGVKDHDVLIHWNFRNDRAEFLMRMLSESEEDITSFLKESPDSTYQASENFQKVKSDIGLDYSTLSFVALMEYFKGIKCPVAFNGIDQHTSLGSMLEEFGFRQYRISGVDKEKAVILLSGGNHRDPFPNEVRYVIPLPQEMRKYKKEFDQKKGEPNYRLNPYARFPKLELPQIRRHILSLIESEQDDCFIIANLSNPDMVGHTADLSAGIITIEEIDHTLLEIGQKVKERGGFLVIVADHGNIEQMMTEDWEPNTFHTDAKVPLIILGKDNLKSIKENGSLKDVAPTILYLLRPEEKKTIEKHFKGNILVEENNGKKESTHFNRRDT